MRASRRGRASFYTHAHIHTHNVHSRTLLIGANGAGKSSLVQFSKVSAIMVILQKQYSRELTFSEFRQLRILAGRHFHSPSKVQILGRPAFHDTSLGRVVAHLGERWGYFLYMYM